MSTALGIVSIGSLAAEVRKPTSDVQRAADALGVQPTLRINGTPFYGDRDAQKIRDRIHGEVTK